MKISIIFCSDYLYFGTGFRLVQVSRFSPEDLLPMFPIPPPSALRSPFPVGVTETWYPLLIQHQVEQRSLQLPVKAREPQFPVKVEEVPFPASTRSPAAVQFPASLLRLKLQHQVDHR
jgi:hypothetical protein